MLSLIPVLKLFLLHVRGRNSGDQSAARAMTLLPLGELISLKMKPGLAWPGNYVPCYAAVSARIGTRGGRWWRPWHGWRGCSRGGGPELKRWRWKSTGSRRIGSPGGWRQWWKGWWSWKECGSWGSWWGRAARRWRWGSDPWEFWIPLLAYCDETLTPWFIWYTCKEKVGKNPSVTGYPWQAGNHWRVHQIPTAWG